MKGLQKKQKKPQKTELSHMYVNPIELEYKGMGHVHHIILLTYNNMNSLSDCWNLQP